jgi:hypothetical protein
MKRFLFCAAILLAGCQGHLHTPQASDPEAGFRHLWALYSECLTVADPDTARLDAFRLLRAALPFAAEQDPPPFLPELLGRLVAEPPLRLSIDPQALAASCVLHSATIAQEHGRVDLAASLFRMVIENYPKPQHASYVEQARAGLTLIASQSVPSMRLVSAP